MAENNKPKVKEEVAKPVAKPAEQKPHIDIR